MIVALRITDEHRSLIATAFVAAYDHAIGNEENKRRSLCCAPDAHEACAAIVGEEFADKLHSFFYEGLGCCGWRNPEHQESEEQYFLDKIANLDELEITK